MTDKSTYSVISTTNIFRILDTLEIPHNISVPILKDLRKWEHMSGPEWTVDRIKSIKQLYLQHYAGNVEFRLPRSKGVNCRQDGSPRGSFGALWTVGFTYKVVNKMMTVLQLYTAYIRLGTPSQKQLSKFLTAVREPRPCGDLPPWKVDPILRYLMRSLWRNARYDRIDHWVSSANKRVCTFRPSKDGFGKITTVYENSLATSDHIRDFIISGNTLLKSKRFVAVCKKAGIVKSVLDVRSAFGAIDNSQKVLLSMRKHNYSLLIKRMKTELIVGSIGFIQERGMKLRAVANPLRMYQVALSKLKNWLMEVSRTILSWDCTYDQSRGVRWAEAKLAAGIKLFAFDLANASDTMPLDDQVALLKHLAPPESSPLYEEYMATIDLFISIARGSWVLFGPGNSQEYLTWTKGQPLGLGPSFALFSITHGLRLSHLASELGLDNDHFVVLGDDVIVTEHLAEAYAQFLDTVWGCDVSVEKTICSSHLTEFASRLVTIDGLVRSWKFPKVNRLLFSTRNPLDLLWRYGDKAINLVPARFREKVKLLASLPPPKGLGMVWDSDVSLDGSQYQSMLMPERREPIPDITYATFHRKSGACYDSVVVRDMPYIERKRELSVSFRAFGNSLKEPPMHFSLKVRPQLRGGTPDNRASKLELQWLILHSNSNLENPDFQFHDYVMEQSQKYPRVISERDSRPEVGHKPTPTRLSAFSRHVRTAVMAAFTSVVTFITLMKSYLNKTETNGHKDDG